MLCRYGQGEKQASVYLRVHMSPQVSLGRLPSKIGSKCPIDYCGVALTGEVGFPPDSFYPSWRYVPGRAGKLLSRFLHLLPCTPPAEHCSQFWPSGRQCLDKLGAQSCDRGTCVSLMDRRERQSRNRLMDALDLF